MVLGFDEQRPSEKEYDDLVRSLTNIIKNYDSPVSFFGYGSYVRLTAVYGESDVDGLIVIHDVENATGISHELSELCAPLIRKSNVPLQISVTDKETIADGRFNSYFEQYRYFFETEGVLFTGPEFLQDMDFVLIKSGPQNQAAHQLRKLRNSFFHKNFLLHDVDVRRQFHSFLNGTSNYVRTISEIVTNECTPERFGSRDFISSLDVTPSFYDELKYITRENVFELDKLYQDTPKMFNTWFRGMGFVNSLTYAFRRKYPKEQDKFYQMNTQLKETS